MTDFKDINLQVGARMQMALMRGGAKPPVYFTELIGYVAGEYLIVKTPFEKGLSVQMNVGERVSLRILSGVDVFTLMCKVKNIFRGPHYYLHLTIPSEINSIALRSAARAKVNLPVQVNDVAEAGIITDISVTGAAITADKTLGELQEKALVSFEFPIIPLKQTAHINAGITIVSTQELPSKKKDQPPRFSHGVVFDGLDLTSQVMLLNLVYESMNKS